MTNNRELGRRLISDDDFNAYLQRFLAWARKAMRGKKALAPHIAVLFSRADGGHDSVMQLLEVDIETETKYRMMLGAGMHLATQFPDRELAALFLITEAWLAIYAKDEGTDVLPSEHPERQEVVVVSGLTMDTRANYATIGIRRTGSGRLKPGGVRVMPWSESDGDIMGEGLPNKMLISMVQGYSLAWLAHKSPKQ